MTLQQYFNKLKDDEQFGPYDSDWDKGRAAMFEDIEHDLLNWKPPETEDRPEGYECLAFHRGKWRHVKWSVSNGWSLGYGQAFIFDLDRKFAPLPPKPEGADGFFDWK